MFGIGIVIALLFQDVNSAIDRLIKDPLNTEAVAEIKASGVSAIPVIETRIFKTDVEVQRVLVRILGDIGDTSATETLLRLSNSESARLRADIAHTFGKIRDRRATGRLIELLSDVDDIPRGEAAWALGEIGDSSAIPALISLTNDPVFTNRARALITLGKLRALSHIPNLDRFLSDPEASVRIGMAMAIDAAQDTSCFHYLEKLTRDKTPFVRIQTYKVIGKFRSDRVKSLLVAGLSDPHEGVRMQALELLIGFNDPDLLPYIIRLKKDVSPAVRKRVNELVKTLKTDVLLQGMIVV
ncbi:MAG TPA: HEAT repeat domain-containing protein, partial [bacterium (Candidatus Stahlbacteria)]|nr:HEAT repeat domain-containing protein [Candidatus Stahlbacteria bacterium]